MTIKLSRFGKHFTRPTGASELMDDLGLAIGSKHPSLLLGGGNPGKIPEIQEYFRQRFHDVATSDEGFERMVANYAHPKGEPVFCETLANLLVREYGWPITADNILLTAGSQAGFFMLFNLLAGEYPDGSRKKILLPMMPEYIGYMDVGLNETFFVSQIPGIEELNDVFFKYRVDFSTLKIGDDVAAICVSRPTNPTGNVITDQELIKLDEMACEADVPLIIDSAYGFPFPGIVFTEAKQIWNENVVICMSLSKLGLPGVRTGIIIAREEIVEALTRMTAVLSLSVGSVGPVLVQPLVKTGEIIKMSRDHIMPFYQKKALIACAHLKRELDGIPFKIHLPEGAFFLWLWIPGLPVTSAELYEKLKAEGVFVISGHHFFPGMDEDWRHRNECLRLSYSQDDDVVANGIRVLGRVVKAILT